MILAYNVTDPVVEKMLASLGSEHVCIATVNLRAAGKHWITEQRIVDLLAGINSATDQTGGNT